MENVSIINIFFDTRNLSLYQQQLHWQSLSDVTILEMWHVLKVCNF
jgi:hypothetical protein